MDIGQALEQECCFPGVLCDGGDTSADRLWQLYGHNIITIILFIFSTPRKSRSRGLKTKIKNKLEWLRVGIVLDWEGLVKED